MFTFFYRHETGTSLLRKSTFMPVARETTDSVAGRRFEDLPAGILIGFPKPSEGMKQKQAVFLREQPARSFQMIVSLTQRNSAGRAYLRARTAFRTYGRVDHILFAFGDGAYRAFVDAGAARNTIFANYVSHITLYLRVSYYPANIALFCVARGRIPGFASICI